MTTIANLPPTKFRYNRWHWDTGPEAALIAHAVLLSDYGGTDFDAACERLERWENPVPHLTGLNRRVANAAQWARQRAARLANEEQSNRP